jgi:hypothetical protein
MPLLTELGNLFLFGSTNMSRRWRFPRRNTVKPSPAVAGFCPLAHRYYGFIGRQMDWR